MAKMLINFRLGPEETERFQALLNRARAKSGKPPTKTDYVKALMGCDYYKLLEGWERDYLSGALASMPESKHHGSFSADAPIIEKIHGGKRKH